MNAKTTDTHGNEIKQQVPGTGSEVVPIRPGIIQIRTLPYVWDGDEEVEFANFLIDDMITENTIGLLVAESTGGKTFTANDIAYAVCFGQPFFGKDTEQGGVIYVAAEAAGTIPIRQKAAREARRPPPSHALDIFRKPLPLATITDVPNLSTTAGVNSLIATVQEIAGQMMEHHKLPVRLIIIDTILAAFGLEDWNSAAQVTAVTNAMKEINKATGAAVMGLGHHGKDISRGPAGSFALKANVDFLLTIVVKRSFGVFDLDAGPVAITLPAAAPRYMAMQIVNEDQFTPAAYYGAGTYTLTKGTIGSRYAMAVVRFFVDFSDEQEVRKIHAMQDAIKVEQKAPGTFEIPNWDEASLKRIRAALLQLGTTISDTRRMYGANKSEVDSVKHLIGSAMLWGGNRERDALYLPITPARNDGKTVYKLTVGEVPVDGFWSVTVYNSEGYFDANRRYAYSLNSITAKKSPDGSVTIQFGGCGVNAQNCLPIAEGWNYTVRLFRPRSAVLDGTWQFPLAQPES
jgi:hypothetical protein